MTGRWRPEWLRRPRADPSVDAGPGTVSIADVADDSFVVETCVSQPARFAGGEGGIVRARDRNPFHRWATSPLALRGYRLRDVVLDRSLMVLLKDGRVVAETNYLQPAASIAAVRVDADRLVRPAVDRPVAVGCDHWDGNFYHWLAHAVPTIHAVRQRHAAAGVGLVLPLLAAWQDESLAMLGAASLPRVVTVPGAQYFLREVEYYEYVAGHADFCASAMCRAAYERMSEGVVPGAARRVYIDRGATTNRRIPNEPALADALRARGFAIVRPETMSLDAQVALFKGADMVVAQLGAGLSNIAFCRPGTVVYELIPEHHPNPCFLAMALQGDLDYWADMFPTGVADANHTSGWQVDIDIAHVMQRIDELEAVSRRANAGGVRGQRVR